MAEFTVSEVIDRDTFMVKEGWKWNQRTGDAVRPTGYNTTEENERRYEEAKRRLSNLIQKIPLRGSRHTKGDAEDPKWLKPADCNCW